MDPKILERLRKISLFLLDLDGTVYLGDEPIPGALEFIRRLKERGCRYVFLTNNSSRSLSNYLTKISGMGFPVTEENILTSGQVTGWYLAAKQPGASVYVVGTESLRRELSSYDLRMLDGVPDRADYVVAGFDTELTYNKLRVAGDLLAEGAGFIATNPDLVCPIGGARYIPDCGSICTMLENATGRQPMFIGKPHTKLIDYLRSRFPVSTATTAMIGDRLYTDIALGCNASIMSICTLTGEADRKAIERSPYKPDLVVASIGELNGYLQE
ncbi:MAG: HAD-IIA family hydrolase [Chitinispirillaceae bacterium]|nr:HAD-IIA family hydrolase [Chitinispirillaceae bacterium]